MKKLYIGNINPTTTEVDLKLYLEVVGPIDSLELAMDRESGLSKGFAYTTMEDDVALRVLQELNGTVLDEYELVIIEYNPRPRR